MKKYNFWTEKKYISYQDGMPCNLLELAEDSIGLIGFGIVIPVVWYGTIIFGTMNLELKTEGLENKIESFESQ